MWRSRPPTSAFAGPTRRPSCAQARSPRAGAASLPSVPGGAMSASICRVSTPACRRAATASRRIRRVHPASHDGLTVIVLQSPDDHGREAFYRARASAASADGVSRVRTDHRLVVAADRSIDNPAGRGRDLDPPTRCHSLRSVASAPASVNMFSFRPWMLQKRHSATRPGSCRTICASSGRHAHTTGGRDHGRHGRHLPI